MLPSVALPATTSLASLALHSSGGLLDYMHPPLCHAIGAEKACDNAKDWWANKQLRKKKSCCSRI